MNEQYRQKDFRLVATDIKEIDNKLLFSQAIWNGLYIIDKQTKEILYNTVFEGEDFTSVMLYYSFQIIGTKAVFTPHSASCIAIFDIEDKILSYVKIENAKKGYHEKYRDSGKFAQSFHYGPFVYMLGYSYPAILKLNIHTLEVTYISSWIDSVNNYIEEGDIWGYFSNGYVIQNDKALIPLGCMAGILELDLNTDETELIFLNISIKKIGGINIFDERNVWITARGKELGKLAVWDVKSNECLEIELPNCFEKFGSYYSPIQVQEKIYLLPEYLGHIYEIDKKSMTVRISEEFEKILQGRQRIGDLSAYVIAPFVNGTDIIFISGWDFKWHIFNPVTAHQFEFVIGAKIDKKKYFKEKLKILHIAKKSMDEIDIGLENYIIGLERLKNKNENFIGVIGRNIYVEMSENS